MAKPTEHHDGWMKIDPTTARQLLLRNSLDQRKIKPSVVHRYAQDMKAGLWQKNAEPIHINKEGYLCNGQHRLQAIIEANVTVEIYVIYDVDATIFDTGYKRNPGDQLRMSGVELPTTASAAAKIVAGAFRPIGSGLYSKYASTHKEELERAYKATCVGTAGRSSKRAACVAATYLMLRTHTAQYFEMEMYWQVYNTMEPKLAGAHDASPVLVARETIDAMNGTRLVRNEMEIIIQSMEEFVKDIHRETPYRIEMPYHWEKYMSEVRGEDGLE